MFNRGWSFGTLLESMDFSRNSLWWGRFMYYPNAVGAFKVL